MTTAFKSIVDAVQGAMLAAPAVAGGRVAVGSDNTTPLDQDSDVNITLQAQGGEQFAITGGPVDWIGDLGIEVRARGSDSVDALTAIDPLVEAVFSRLAAVAWPAGVMGLQSIRCQFDVQEAATPFATCKLLQTLSFRTAPGSLALAP